MRLSLDFNNIVAKALSSNFALGFADTAVSGRGHFEDFRPRFMFWHICHVDCHGQYTLKQLRLSVVSEMHTNIYTGPRLKGQQKLSPASPIFRLPSM